MHTIHTLGTYYVQLSSTWYVTCVYKLMWFFIFILLPFLFTEKLVFVSASSSPSRNSYTIAYYPCSLMYFNVQRHLAFFFSSFPHIFFLFPLLLFLVVCSSGGPFPFHLLIILTFPDFLPLSPLATETSRSATATHTNAIHIYVPSTPPKA